MPRSSETTAFATQLLELLDRTRTNSTYKYAVLMGLVEVCQEEFDASGRAPEMVTTRQLARKVLEIYWRQSRRHPEFGELLQNQGAQALILNRISEFQEKHPGATSVFTARRAHPKDYVRLVDRIEWKLIEAPLPRLQRVGNIEVEFLYTINWEVEDVRKQKRASGVSAYQRRFGPSDVGERNVSTEGFDNRIQLKPEVGDHLVRLAPLIRPLIRREWTGMVAQLNDLRSEELERFLFGANRSSLADLADPVKDLQDGTCFYCGRGMRGTEEIDHFIAWSRHPHDDIFNLVVAHDSCNRHKREHLAAPSHLEKWLDRIESKAGDALAEVADDFEVAADREKTLAVGRSNYLPLPDGTPLWLRGTSEFVEADPNELEAVFAGVGG